MQKKTNKHPTKRLDDLVFMVPNYGTEKEAHPGLSFYNVFRLVKVRDAIAIYKYSKAYQNYVESLKREGHKEDWAFWVFSSTRGRVQYELSIGAPFDDAGEKTDIYTLFIKPNEALLKSMVDSVSRASCKEAWEEYKRRLAERRRLFKEYQKVKKEHETKN